MITKDKLDELFFVDLNNGKMYWKKPTKYHPDLAGKEAGCNRQYKNSGYWVIKIDGKAYKRSRLLFFYKHNKFPSPCVDHIDGNSLNDCIHNLREASLLENSWNHRTRKKSTSLPMGIRQTKTGYVARIAFKKKTIHLGVFLTVEDAEKAYKQKRIELYGRFSGY
jgi:hypothetical protein